MRTRDLVRVLGLLSVAVWTVTASAGPPGAQAQRGFLGLGYLEGLRTSGSRVESMGNLFPNPQGAHTQLFPGQPTSGPSAPSMAMGAAIIAAEHVAMGIERGEAVAPQPIAPGPGPGAGAAPSAAGTDEAGAATAQPHLTANPWAPRPPGAVGPGQRASGQPGPGLPGPGQRVSPRW